MINEPFFYVVNGTLSILAESIEYQGYSSFMEIKIVLIRVYFSNQQSIDLVPKMVPSMRLIFQGRDFAHPVHRLFVIFAT